MQLADGPISLHMDENNVITKVFFYDDATNPSNQGTLYLGIQPWSFFIHRLLNCFFMVFMNATHLGDAKNARLILNFFKSMHFPQPHRPGRFH
ncbi:hypothetical protein SAMN03080602_00905 [Arenibacter troitsensis]|uniref:Uncharacterized protein n=1 Tax=Arenibacter troitsensis TaxID=188872 RepID=A0A1X7IK95_9FLAO|nr:hypothetical protein SAMN03080602_00905 [Arenibacter troitsensis]